MWASLLLRLNPYLTYIKLAAIALAAISLFAAGWHAKAVLVEAEHNKEIVEAQKRADIISTKTEAKLSQLRNDNRRLNNALNAELKNPGYACPVPAAGVLLRNGSLNPSR